MLYTVTKCFVLAIGLRILHSLTLELRFARLYLLIRNRPSLHGLTFSTNTTANDVDRPHFVAYYRANVAFSVVQLYLPFLIDHDQHAVVQFNSLYKHAFKNHYPYQFFK